MKKITIILLLILCFTLYANAREDKSYEDAFAEAEIAYSWFTSYCIHSTIGTLDFENNRQGYYKIKDGITDMQQLRNHLLSIFSEEIADDLLSRKIDGKSYFIEENGDLYYTLAAIGLNDYTIGERKLAIKEESGKSIILELEYRCVDEGFTYNAETIEYLAKKDDSGKIIFTSFILPATKWTFMDSNVQTGDTNLLIYLLLVNALGLIVLKQRKEGKRKLLPS